MAKQKQSILGGFKPVSQATQSKPRKSFADLKKHEALKKQEDNSPLHIEKIDDDSSSSSKPKSSLFHPKPKKKPIQYGNIRVNKDVVEKLKKAQYVNGFKSRSDLLEAMIKFCSRAMFYGTPKQVRLGKQFDEIAKIKSNRKNR